MSGAGGIPADGRPWARREPPWPVGGLEGSHSIGTRDPGNGKKASAPAHPVPGSAGQPRAWARRAAASPGKMQGSGARGLALLESGRESLLSWPVPRRCLQAVGVGSPRKLTAEIGDERAPSEPVGALAAALRAQHWRFLESCVSCERELCNLTLSPPLSS